MPATARTTDQPTPPRRGRRVLRPALTLLGIGLLAGLLLYSKLRLATDMPQSAYAVPRDKGQDAARPTPPSTRDAPPPANKPQRPRAESKADPRLMD